MRLTATIPVLLIGAAVIVAPAGAQTPPQGTATSAAAPAPPPATKLEAFHPAAGSVVTLGYTELGRVAGAAVDVRELRDAGGRAVRGLLVEVTQSQYREGRSFVDADELPELLRGIDALLEVKANPTSFRTFEVRYTTKGELQLTAFSNARGGVEYAIRAGRGVPASTFTDEAGMRRLRTMIEAAIATLGAPAAGSGR
jgi:hypothetical protein